MGHSVSVNQALSQISYIAKDDFEFLTTFFKIYFIVCVFASCSSRRVVRRLAWVWRLEDVG